MNTITESISIPSVIMKEIGIAICVGLAYFLMLYFTPLNALFGAASIAALANIRWANILKPMVLISPSAAIGIATGSYCFKVYAGKMAFGVYPLIPIIMFGLSVVMYMLSQKIGRSTKKDLFVLTIFAVLSALVIILNQASIAVALSSATWAIIFSVGAAWKIAWHIAIFWAGYPICRYFESVVRKR